MVGFGIIVLGYIWVLYFGATIVPGAGLSGHLLVQVPQGFWSGPMRRAMES